MDQEMKNKVAGINFEEAVSPVAMSFFDMAAANHNALRAIEGQAAPRVAPALALQPGM